MEMWTGLGRPSTGSPEWWGWLASVLAHLKSTTHPVLDPMQFAYRANGSTEDAGNMALQYVLEHLDTAGNYTRLLFVDFSSADPSWSTSFLDFLTNRSQRVKLGKIIPSTRSTSTGSPQSFVLSPLLFSLYINNSVSLYPSVKLLKFADDTTLVGESPICQILPEPLENSAADADILP